MFVFRKKVESINNKELMKLKYKINIKERNLIWFNSDNLTIKNLSDLITKSKYLVLDNYIISCKDILFIEQS